MQVPENTLKRLFKVIVRSIHLVGMAGVFGNALMQTSGPVYLSIAVASGIVLVMMEASSGLIWFVQLRGVSLYLKLLLLLLMHLKPEITIPCLIAVIVISGFMSHAPSWIRYFSLQHGRVVLSDNDLLG
jgi:hypothetical protein